MQAQPKLIPAWQRVFNLPELCDIVLISLTPSDIARLSRVSHIFHSFWAPRLWYSIVLTTTNLGLPLPQDIEAHSPLVREVRFCLNPRQSTEQKPAPVMSVMDKIRIHCRNLQTVQLNFRHCFAKKIFPDSVLGVSHEVLDEIFQPYPRESESGTTIMLEFCRLLQVDAAKNNSGDKREKQEESLQDPTVWYRPLIPSSPANGFLSSTIRSLNLDVESWYTDNVLTWLTRAGWEGHLQGLVRLRLNSDPIRKLDEPIKIERELFLQTLEAFPRLSELFAPQLQVITDAVRRGNQKSRIHADILDPLNDHPMAKNLAARRRQPLKIQKLTVWSLGLGEGNGETSHSLSSSSSLLSTQESWSALLCRFPCLTDLTFEYESIPGLVKALNHPLRDQQHRNNIIVNNNNNNNNNKEGFDPFTATAIQPITRLTMMLSGCERKVLEFSMLSSVKWRCLLLSPALRLETLDLRERCLIPKELLDNLAISSSSKSLKRVLCNPHGDYILESSAVQKFFRSAIELEEFQCPRTTRFVIEEFFTPEESARWPCLNRLRSLKILSSDVDLQGSEIHSAQMRRWVWSFGPKLKELIVLGIHATVDVLLDPSSCSSSCMSLSSPATPLLSAPPPRGLKINKLTLPDFQESSALTLNQTKFVFEQLLRGTSFGDCFCRFDEESSSWLETKHDFSDCDRDCNLCRIWFYRYLQ